MAEERITIGGREFKQMGVGPVRQDLYVMQHARLAGLTGTKIAEGETPEEFVNRLIDSMIASGRALALLGGLLVPAELKPEEWTEEVAGSTAAFLGGLRDPEEKRKVYGEVASALLGFSVNGLGSWAASLQSSNADEKAEQGTNPPAGSGTGPGLLGAYRAEIGTNP